MRLVIVWVLSAITVAFVVLLLNVHAGLPIDIPASLMIFVLLMISVVWATMMGVQLENEETGS